jgi:prolipoprotein diacylglyceryltransferase
LASGSGISFTPIPNLFDKGIKPVYYLTHPFEAIAIWNGGLGIPVAVINGMLAVFIFTRNHHLPYIFLVVLIAYWAIFKYPSHLLRKFFISVR